MGAQHAKTNVLSRWDGSALELRRGNVTRAAGMAWYSPAAIGMRSPRKPTGAGPGDPPQLVAMEKPRKDNRLEKMLLGEKRVREKMTHGRINTVGKENYWSAVFLFPRFTMSCHLNMLPLMEENTVTLTTVIEPITCGLQYQWMSWESMVLFSSLLCFLWGFFLLVNSCLHCVLTYFAAFDFAFYFETIFWVTCIDFFVMVDKK